MAEEKILTENELDGVSGGNRLDLSDKAKVDVDKLRKLRKLRKDEGTETCVGRSEAALTDSELNCVTGGSGTAEIRIQAKGTAAKTEAIRAAKINDGTITTGCSGATSVLTESDLNCVTGGSKIQASDNIQVSNNIQVKGGAVKTATSVLTESDLNCVTGGNDITEIRLQAKADAAKTEAIRAAKINSGAVTTGCSGATAVLTESDLNCVTGGSGTTDATIKDIPSTINTEANNRFVDGNSVTVPAGSSYTPANSSYVVEGAYKKLR